MPLPYQGSAHAQVVVPALRERRSITSALALRSRQADPRLRAVGRPDDPPFGRRRKLLPSPQLDSSLRPRGPAQPPCDPGRRWRMQRTMLVTGAASGSGRAIALRFARDGWFVGLTDIDRRGLDATAAEIAGPHVIQPFDVRDGAGWEAAVAAFAAAAGGRLDVFVNNAGIAHSGNLADTPPAAAVATVEVNLIGAMRGIFACLPLLK